MPNYCPPQTAALEPFNFEGTTPVRVVFGDDGQPLFVAKDVAEALGYSWQTNVIGHVLPEWKGVRPINTPGGPQNLSVLTEPGLYFFLGRSDKPKALHFQKWIAGEVVPTIRKTGTYSVDPRLTAASTLATRPNSELLRLAANLAEENERQAKQLEEQRPAVEFVDRYVEAKGSLGVRRVAKVIGRKQNDLVAELLRDKVMYREGGKLVPFAEYQERGYFAVKAGEKDGKAFAHARFTPKGIAWAAKRFGHPASEASTSAMTAAPRQGRLL